MCSSAHEDFGDELRWGEGEQYRGAVNRVGYTDVVGDVRKDGLSVGFDVVDDRLIIGYHEYTTVRESKYSVQDVY